MTRSASDEHGTTTRLVVRTLLTLVAFAANSLLCRAALGEGRIDAATFTGVRLVSGALMLLLLVGIRARRAGVARRVHAHHHHRD